MITPEELKAAAEILGRLADRYNKPDADSRVRVLFDKKYFGALQQLLKGTDWHNRYCWETTGGHQVFLSVDTIPIPAMVICTRCMGKGVVQEGTK